jgi:putative salt-induced outer membrane protein YdiY
MTRKKSLGERDLKLLAPLAPILAICAFPNPAVADGTGFGNVDAITGERLRAGIEESALSRERYRLAAEYDPNPDSAWYGFVGGDLELDQTEDGRIRSVLSSGPGYRFYDNDQVKLSLQGGLSYSDVALRNKSDNGYPGLNWGFNWEQTFFDQHLNFFHRHHGNQGLGSSNNLSINSETGIRVPLSSRFSATASYDLEWEGSPHDENRNADHSYMLGLGYDW